MKNPEETRDQKKSRRIDDALKMVFEKEAQPPSRSSILNQLEGQSGVSMTVHLSHAVREEGPMLRAPATKIRDLLNTTRYQIVGEIAHGGVGVVYKGRDVDLGRDVAMKVLHDHMKSNPDVVQRFVEEAQIGGQLQHPGIVPVYELGLQADERPYFTMKLVQGQTLAALLTKRKSPMDDRHRHLQIFEQICQTIAYAHARGVVHRDLKPSNIMVGAFGEVQVVDWGFAKVLGQGGLIDESRASVSPERGDNI